MGFKCIAADYKESLDIKMVDGFHGTHEMLFKTNIYFSFYRYCSSNGIVNIFCNK